MELKMLIPGGKVRQFYLVGIIPEMLKGLKVFQEQRDQIMLPVKGQGASQERVDQGIISLGQAQERVDQGIISLGQAQEPSLEEICLMRKP